MIQRRTNKTPRAGPNARARNRVRIVGGDWRSRIVEFPDAPGLRPTADRVRETLFNWLGQTMHGKRCLDLFSGSGALGFEALSRGAEQVVMVENHKPAYLALQENARLLDATHAALRYADAEAYLRGCGERFDVIFLDPPFEADVLPRILPMLRARLTDDGLVYLETGKPLADATRGWRIVKQGKAGMVNFGLLAFDNESAGGTA